eukprot:7384323-Prymnesium_polylepis.1
MLPDLGRSNQGRCGRAGLRSVDDAHNFIRVLADAPCVQNSGWTAALPASCTGCARAPIAQPALTAAADRWVSGVGRQHTLAAHRLLRRR